MAFEYSKNFYIIFLDSINYSIVLKQQFADVRSGNFGDNPANLRIADYTICSINNFLDE
jgi:hypothetical protein